MGVKMSGNNKFAGYKYYELSDITPAINALERKYKFVCLVSFNAETGTLTIVDTETASDKTDKITFTSPMATAALKGCHDVQNLGAAETYIKRYLYQHAFEIVEADVLNLTHNPEQTPKKEAAKKPFDPDVAVNWLCEKYDIFPSDIETLLGRPNAKSITLDEFHELDRMGKDGTLVAELKEKAIF